MEVWFVIVVSVCISAIVSSFFNLFKKNLPPGPPTWLLIGNLIWLRRPVSELEFILRRLKTRYGPLMTISIGPRKLIFVGSHSLAHRALIQHGAIFSDRPPPRATSKVLNRPRRVINAAAYGPTWRLLRRNLAHGILHPGRVKSYSSSRQWVLSILISRLKEAVESESSVTLIDHFEYTMCCLLGIICFGDKLDETQIKEIESGQRRLLLGFQRFNVLNFWPLGKILFRSRWKELLRLRLEQEKVLIPLIRSRIQAKQQRISNHQEDDEAVTAYVDTLVDLQLPEENRKLEESEFVSLCSEFIGAGTHTTSTALQWIMANLVKYPHIQTKLYQEMSGVLGLSKTVQHQTIEEEDLLKMPYLKAVVLEALRRHPPLHFVLPHKVTEDIELDGYTIPRDATVNFMVADMGWDPKVWEDPMEFKPERFLGANNIGELFDITGRREIKMMPFGAGRRICPGLALALLHLEYFVANLIWNFEWIPVEGDDVDLTEKQELTTVMKNPLRARISPRIS